MEQNLILIDKSHTAGFSVRVGELLKALKHKAFKDSPDEAPIFIHQTTGDENEEDMQALTAVFFCGEKSCQNLHLQAGWYDTANEVLSKNAVIFQDYRDREDRYVIRKELIEILNSIENKDTKVIICTTGDESLTVLTTVLKCSADCPSVHLLGGYTHETYNPN